MLLAINFDLMPEVILKERRSNSDLGIFKIIAKIDIEQRKICTSYCVLPSLNRKSTEVILHAGTNDVKFSESQEIAEDIVNLELKIQNYSRYY